MVRRGRRRACLLTPLPLRRRRNRRAIPPSRESLKRPRSRPELATPRPALWPWPTHTPRRSDGHSRAGRRATRVAPATSVDGAPAAAPGDRRDSHQPVMRARVSAISVPSPASGNSVSVCLRVSSIQVAPSAASSTTTRNRTTSETSLVNSSRSTTSARTTYAHTRFSRAGASPRRTLSALRPGPASHAAIRKRSPTTTISRNDPRIKSVRMFHALSAALRSSWLATSALTT